MNARAAPLRVLTAAVLALAAAAAGATAAGAAAHGAAAAPTCPQQRQARAAAERVGAALAQARFISYQPTSLKVLEGRVTPANPESIRADLRVLRQKFDALITYDAVHGTGDIAPIAAALKFRALIIGVWNPDDEAEVAAAIAAAQRFPQLVVGISLGNETLFSERSDPARLAARLAGLHQRLPGTALSTTEPFHVFYQPAAAPVLGQLDFLLVNVHPLFQPWFQQASDRTAAQFVVNVLAQLTRLGCGPILVKETGLPSAPASANLSEARQAAFYRELRGMLTPTVHQAFAYFAAFDAPWRAYDATGVPGAAAGVHPEEAHWGLYDAERRPKLAARELPPLPQQPAQ